MGIAFLMFFLAGGASSAQRPMQRSTEPQVLLVRHANSECNINALIPTPDELLTPKGLRQAASLGRELLQRNICIDQFLTSDAERTVATTLGALKQLGADGKVVRFTKLLHERRFGEVEGMSYTDAEALRIELEAASESGITEGDTDGAANTLDKYAEQVGAETTAEFRARVADAWEIIKARALSLAEAAPGEAEPVLVVVTHALVLEELLRSHIDTDGSFNKRGARNASVSSVRVPLDGVGKGRLVEYDCVNHLAPELLGDENDKGPIEQLLGKADASGASLSMRLPRLISKL